MKTAFAILILIHGVIHLLGFAKAFQLADISQLTRPVSKPAGIAWLLAAVLFLVSLCLLLLNSTAWWIMAGIAVILSQFLIIQRWTDAKFGSMANLIILLPVIVSLINHLPSSFQNRYRAEVEKRLNPISETSLVSREDAEHLPAPVQKYLEYAGAVGKPKVHNFRAVFRGSMKRSMDGDWLDIVSRQYDFFDDPARLFTIEAALFGIPFDGLHMYVGDSATMQIKVASVFQVADAKGEKMNQGETVTLFNDMCLLAPATLIDKSIQWEAVDSLRVKAKFTNKGNSITAMLTFNAEGQLTDFISNDRYLSADGTTYTNYPWSTPVKEYRDFGGRMTVAYGQAIWHTPEGEYCYAKFDLAEIEYNCSEFR
jgi:hypothetical protein